jgi:regulatory protein
LKVIRNELFLRYFGRKIKGFGNGRELYIFLHKDMIQENGPAIIEKIKKVTGGVRLYVNILELPLFLPASLVEKDDLKEGVELHPAYLKQLKADAQVYEFEFKAAGILSRRDYSIGEFKRKLRLSNFGEESIREIVSKCKARGLLDDKKYANKVVNRILKEKPSGKGYLIAALRRKLIPRDLADETVNSILESQDDTELAVQALTKRWRQLSQFEVEEARRKAYNYLSRRGFNYSAAKAAFTKLWNKESGENFEENDN